MATTSTATQSFAGFPMHGDRLIFGTGMHHREKAPLDRFRRAVVELCSEHFRALAPVNAWLRSVLT